MEWYNGGVPGAISSCREKNALFIVYVHDDSPESKSTDEAWKSPEVCELVAANSYVALKVIKDSLEYRQFSQLFAVFMFPSVFCIGRTGKPLVIMNGAQSSSQLKDKLSEGFQKYQDEVSGASQSSTSVTTPQPEPSGPVTTPPVSMSSTTSTSSASGASIAAPQETKEEKLRYYQEKIKERRIEKEEEQFKKEKQREIDRRDQGRNIAKFKQQQEEQRNQDWLQERRRQKEEERKAREEIRAKLEQDKLERLAQKKMAASELQSQRSQPGSSGVASVLSSVTTSRIQLRLPTGDTRVIQLNKTDSLEVLRDTVARELDVRVSDLVLTSVYPRKALNDDLNSQTMVELQLVPSGVVLVTTKKSMISSIKSSGGGGGGGGILGALMSLLQLIISFFTFIKNAIVGLFSGGSGNQSADRQGSQYQPERHRQRNDTEMSRTQRGGGDGLRVRKFRQEDYQDDSDEERSTYNGNSTQQQ